MVIKQKNVKNQKWAQELTHLFVKGSRLVDSKVTFLVFEWGFCA